MASGQVEPLPQVHFRESLEAQMAPKKLVPILGSNQDSQMLHSEVEAE